MGKTAVPGQAVTTRVATRLERNALCDQSFLQQLNLCSYVRNSPLSLTDPDGRDIAVKYADKANCTAATGQVNSRKDGQFKVGVGKDGKWHPVGKVDTSKLSEAEKAFYGALTYTVTHATLIIVSGRWRSPFQLKYRQRRERKIKGAKAASCISGTA